MNITIPGRDALQISNIVFDYNGTIAINGQLINGVGELINEYARSFNFYVITADTYGTVEKDLSDVACRVVKIEENDQDRAKLEFLNNLGKHETLCVGNGRNDRLMLKEAALGIALIQEEGGCVETLLAADIACRSVFDVFGFLKTPNGLIATLRN